MDSRYRKLEVTFRVTGDPQRTEFRAFDWPVPESYAGPIALHPKKLTADLRRIPIGNWRKSVFPSVPLDSDAEYQVAQLLDGAASVDWWIRNDPAQFAIATPVGRFRPDFLFSRSKSGGGFGIVEVKGQIFWEDPASAARVKARSAVAWCEALNGAEVEGWEFALVLDADVSRVKSLEGLLDSAVARV